MMEYVLCKRALALRLSIVVLALLLCIIALPNAFAAESLEGPSNQNSKGNTKEHYFHRSSFSDPQGYVMHDDQPGEISYCRQPLGINETAAFYTYPVQDDGGALLAKGEWALHIDVSAAGNATLLICIGIYHKDGTESTLITNEISAPSSDGGISRISRNWNKQPAIWLAQGDRIFAKISNSGPSGNVSLCFDSSNHDSRLKTPKIDPPIEISAMTLGGAVVGAPLLVFGFSRIYIKYFGSDVKQFSASTTKNTIDERNRTAAFENLLRGKP